MSDEERKAWGTLSGRLMRLEEDLKLLPQLQSTLLTLNDHVERLRSSDSERTRAVTTLAQNLDASQASFRGALETQRNDLMDALKKQEDRWRAQSNELAGAALDKLQEVALKAIGKRLVDWLWTIGFAGLMAGAAWIAAHATH